MALRDVGLVDGVEAVVVVPLCTECAVAEPVADGGICIVQLSIRVTDTLWVGLETNETGVSNKTR